LERRTGADAVASRHPARRIESEKMKVVTDPVKALVDVGKENSELHEELARCYAELDLYRDTLTLISKMPTPAAAVALRALAQKMGN
jgi:thioredoxin-like negative regulator of GroEL